MSIFNRIFRRDRDEESEDLSIYKTEEPTTNRFTSFLFGFFALLVTLVIAGGIFYGTRAIYRTLNGDSGGQVSTPSNSGSNTQQPASTQSKTEDDKSKTSTKKPGNTPSTGDNLPSTGDNLQLPKTGDPGM